MESQHAQGIRTTIQDSLFLRVFTNNTSENLRLRARWTNPDGELFHIEIPLDTNASVPSFLASQQLAEGHIISMSVVDLNAQLIHGECWVQAGILSRGSALTDASIVLIEGYVTGNRPISWPGTRNEGMRDGVGHYQIIAPANPALGANVLWTVPDNEHFIVRGMRLSFQADGTAANREILFSITDTFPLHITEGICTTYHTAGQLAHYFAGPNLHPIASQDTTTRIRNIAFPEHYAGPGYELRCMITNIQGGDAVTNFRAWVNSWMTDS